MAEGSEGDRGFKAARDRLGANLARQMKLAGFSVADIARRAEVEPEEVERVLGGEDEDLTTTDVAVLAGAARCRPGDLIAGIRWVPYGLDRRPAGEWKIDDID